MDFFTEAARVNPRFSATAAAHADGLFRINVSNLGTGRGYLTWISRFFGCCANQFLSDREARL
jgi:hypothetical protein